MNIFNQLKHYTLQYYGIDWLVTITVFIGVFLLGEKKKSGFVMGMISTVVALIFSFQIQSIANGVASIILFSVYLRGYLKWKK